MAPRIRQKAIVEKARLAAYSAAAAAAAVAAPSIADASITHVNVNAVESDPTANGSGVGTVLNFGNASSFHIVLAHSLQSAGHGVAFFGTFGAAPGVSVAGFNAGAFHYASNVAYNAAISAQPGFIAAAANGTMAFNGGYANSQFLNPGIGFIGVKFNTNQYGWIRVNMDGAPLNTFTIVDYAFAGPGETIHAGEVPEPGTLGLLALGAVGLAKWRRRKIA